MRYASITSCTDNYKPYLNAQLNSLDATGVKDLDYHLVAIDIDPAYLERVKAADWSFNVIIHERHLYDYPFALQGKNLTSKKARYHLLESRNWPYDAMVFLDVDMMIVKDITQFLGLVEGTKTIIGCNEKFKWNLGRYIYEGEALPEMAMYWFVCNSPLFFDPNRQRIFIKHAARAATTLQEITGKIPSDLFTMNVALYLSGMYTRVIGLPSQCWVGNHNGYFSWWSRIFKRGGRWVSETGEQVYMIHGRWVSDKCDRSQRNELRKRLNELGSPPAIVDKHMAKMDDTLKQIQEQFKYFNTEHKLRI